MECPLTIAATDPPLITGVAGGDGVRSGGGVEELVLVLVLLLALLLPLTLCNRSAAKSAATTTTSNAPITTNGFQPLRGAATEVVLRALAQAGSVDSGPVPPSGAVVSPSSSEAGSPGCSPDDDPEAATGLSSLAGSGCPSVVASPSEDGIGPR
jgi:hypothetical protein